MYLCNACHVMLFQTADVDGDGVISQEDFRAMIEPALAAGARKASVTHGANQSQQLTAPGNNNNHSHR